METRELRINNIITQYRMETRVFMLSFEIDDNIHVNGESPESCEPIPLTEDWMAKLGLNSVVSGEWEIRISKGARLFVDMHYGKKDGYSCGLETMTESIYIKDILYIHEAQNLFYSLTGKELTLKETA